MLKSALVVKATTVVVSSAYYGSARAECLPLGGNSEDRIFRPTV